MSKAEFERLRQGSREEHRKLAGGRAQSGYTDIVPSARKTAVDGGAKHAAFSAITSVICGEV